jgi:hypothetical protein
VYIRELEVASDLMPTGGAHTVGDEFMFGFQANWGPKKLPFLLSLPCSRPYTVELR